MTTASEADRRWDCAADSRGSLDTQSLVGSSAFGQLAGGGGGIPACGSCDSIAESARALALGKPASSKKAADEESLALPQPPSSRSSSRLSAHGHWAAPPPEPPPAPGLLAALRGALGGGGTSTSASDAEREPLMGDDAEAGAPPPPPPPPSWEATSWEAFASLKARVAPPPPPKPGPCDCVCRRLPALSYQQRLLGFLACLVIGLMISLTSLMSFGSLLTGNPTPFALKYTIGNLLSIGASGFLVGPAKQCRDMFAPVRRVASLLYVASLGTTLVCIFYLRSRLLTTVSICVQLGAMVWYCVSYLPFGQNMLRRVLGWMCRL